MAQTFLRCYTGPMKVILFVVMLLPPVAFGADIKVTNNIACISDESSLNGRRIETAPQENSSETKSRITEWKMAENFGNQKSKINFQWIPEGEKGPAIRLETTDKPHNRIAIRSHAKDSLVVVSSTSNFYSTESWTFALNFNVETLIATRVQSNVAGVGAELITYDCRFESVDAEM